jgi:hypothetical protein
MALRKLAAIAPVIAVLSLAAPVAGANAQTTPIAGSAIPCFPFPAFCNAQGEPTVPLAYPYAYLIPLFRGIFGTPPSVAGSPS